MTPTAYTEEQYDASYSDGVEHYWWHLARNKIVLREVSRLAEKRSVVLDVGCGRGIAVKYMRDHDIACDGVELATTNPLPEVSEHICYGISAVDLPVSERIVYNTIMLLDVIEHLPDPVHFVSELAKAFPNLKHFVVTVPACPELWSNYDKYFGHFRRYTASSMREFADASSLELLHQSYFFHSLYVPARALALLNKQRSVRVNAPIGWKRRLHRIVGGAMYLDYRIIPSRVLGMSLIACMRIRR